ncbi:oxygen-independent coproporphyrinogen III oxidase [Chitinimonas koreensis]|uniref:oxygen-independent coproporphyrinogen III oxidase n=1 Tax=Chitinimonas koreensis TaxID=356302 RepID=UPI00040533F3|nr:oxygen-independent coproporphyrinogen III oxidase [Chitinimonas koreensis]QNM95123.1 oxygen-independent coproporphyrinogen III oxidase [Chitinimonas koreensis]
MNAPYSPPPGGRDDFDVQGLQFDKALIERLAGNGPRYTSYPSADRFHDGFGEAEYRAAVAENFPAGAARPLSLYLHIPFCDTICYYCGCNKIITKNRAHAEVYLDYLEREIALQAPLFAGRARIEQMHFGGGTPTFLSDAQLARLIGTLRRHFDFAPAAEGEYSIEIDPRKVGPATVARLAELGFNRMSLGVQDFDPAVQRAVNRIQSEEETLAVIEAARAHGFRSISIDLIYGLPLQTQAGFGATLDKVIAARPDRLSVYHYAHLPHLFKTQRQIDEAELPSPSAKLDLLGLAIARLTAAGYVYIGMDHFALPGDELAVAQRAGTLQRNFQGYSTRDDIDLLALGVSGIGKIGASYSQNVRGTDDYYALLDAGRLPLLRGIGLSRDDALRRGLIRELMCQFELDLGRIETQWGIRFADYFAAELERLAQLAADGLIELDPAGGRLRVLPRGRLLVRNVAMAFDRYLQQGQPLRRYSRTL